MLERVYIPEDATAHKVAILYVYNQETNEFYPTSQNLYSTLPKIHRENITSIDSNYPTQGIDCRGFSKCRFDLILEGTNVTNLKVDTIRYNPTANKWFHSGVPLQLKDHINSNISIIEDDSYGVQIYLYVIEFEGDSFNLTVYYSLC